MLVSGLHSGPSSDSTNQSKKKLISTLRQDSILHLDLLDQREFGNVTQAVLSSLLVIQ